MSDIYADLRTVRAGSIPIAVELCRLGKVRETVNHLVHWKEANTKVSPGLLIESLVICILCGRKPLWKVEQFWASQDLENVFAGVELSVDQLNDDAYGRALDKLAEIKMEELVSTIGLTLLQAHNLGIGFVHFDTTNKQVQGEYGGAAPEEFDIRYGHCKKNNRPDLKQFKIGAGVQENGQVIMGELLPGNKLDVHWNPDSALKMQQLFSEQGFKDVIFVSDCALVSTEGLQKIGKDVQFISRLPETFGLANELKQMAWEADCWEEIGPLADVTSPKAAHYKTYTVRREFCGREYGFVVVQSSALEAKKEKTILKQVGKKQAELAKQAKALSKQEFACEADAAAALQAFTNKVQKQNFTILGKVEVITTLTYTHKGRPKKGEQGTETTIYHVECTIGDMDSVAFAQLLRKEAAFVLISSIRDYQKYDSRAILSEYKRQISIENKFRFLKSPVYLGPVYLKSKSRIQALGYVFILVLMLASYLEYRVRTALKEANQGIRQPGNKMTSTPSVTTILEILDKIEVIIFQGQRLFPKNIDKQAVEMIKWAGFDTDIYLKPQTVVND